MRLYSNKRSFYKHKNEQQDEQFIAWDRNFNFLIVFWGENSFLQLQQQKVIAWLTDNIMNGFGYEDKTFALIMMMNILF